MATHLLTLLQTTTPSGVGMSDGLKITLTALTAIATFVAGQIFVKVIVEPIQKQRTLVGKLAFAINHYAAAGLPFDQNAMKESVESVVEARNAIRQLGSEFRATLSEIPFYRFFSLFGLVLPCHKVLRASYHLFTWQCSMRKQMVDYHVQALAKLLKVKYEDEKIRQSILDDMKQYLETAQPAPNVPTNEPIRRRL
jgi:hypothetical protein